MRAFPSMRRAGISIASLALCLAGLFILPSLAVARTAYFTASEEGNGYAAPIDLSSGAIGAPVPIVTEGPPSDVAITPDGSTAYVTGYEELVPINVATDTEEPPILMSVFEPRAIAIAPDGKHVYTANGFQESVSVIDPATGTEVGSPIAVGRGAAGIAVTPDGSRAYVTNAEDGTVSVIDLATETVIATIGVGNEPVGVAVAPDGKRVYVANGNAETVSEIDVATNAVTKTIGTGVRGGDRIAISPDGSHAYVLSVTAGEGVTPIDLATGTVGATVPLAGFAADIAILPDGSRAYITHEEAQVATGDLLPFDLSTNAFGAGFELGEAPRALAIVPNQPPHASFTATPQSAEPGQSVSFDGSGSTDSDGTVARYDWEFGDGSSAADGGATPSHSYAKAGTYQVTLTVTDNEGCSTQLVFTGQTAYCNGSAVARVTHPVTVAAPVIAPAPVRHHRRRRLCRVLKGHATSFHPKIRPGHVVPGVRVRLAASQPSRFIVKATLLWRRHGRTRHAALGRLAVRIHRWRRVRFPIPVRLRGVLPHGSRVGVRLRIEVRPLHGASCAPSVVHRTLHVRVVNVFPHAVQRGRIP